jgi:hypothetical protein
MVYPDIECNVTKIKETRGDFNHYVLKYQQTQKPEMF